LFGHGLLENYGTTLNENEVRCIFCKADSSSSKSVEHIIPDSLGNKDHILARGIVCDKCNNYFSLKIEKPVLDKPYFISLRHRNFIENKKARIPLERGFIGNDPNVFIDVNGGDRSIVVDNPNTVNKIINNQVGFMILPTISSPPKIDRDISRLLGKIAIEVLVHKFYPDQTLIDEIIDKPELNDLKNYVRIGDKPDHWEYHERRLYNEEDRFYNPKIKSGPYEVLHEFTLLYTEKMEMYLVIVIMGIEYAINFTHPKIDGYQEWLIKHQNVSPLFDLNEKRIIMTPEELWQAGDKLKFVTRK
jgi:hypothetical protein